VKGVEEKAAGGPGIVYDPGRRFPFITSPEGYDALMYLSDNEKQLGVEMLKVNYAEVPGVEQPPEHHAVQLRNPIMMFQSDPELFVQDDNDAKAIYEVVLGMPLQKLMEFTDKSGPTIEDPAVLRRFQMIMLLVAKVAQEVKSDWTLQLVATGPNWGWLTRQQLCLLDQPHSAVWNDEQRLMLEYTHAVVHYDVPDQLFERAEAAWGRKQLLRYTAMIAKYAGAHMIYHVNITDAEKRGQVR
jgi:hypothetical protein